MTLIIFGVLIAIVSAPIRFLVFIGKGFETPTERNFVKYFFEIISDLSCMFCLPVVYVVLDEGSSLGINTIGGSLFWGAWILTCVSAYFIATFSAKILPIFQEFFLNLLLGAGVAINLFIGFDLAYIQDEGIWLAAIGNGPIILLFLIALMKRYKSFTSRLPAAADALRQSRAEVLDYLPGEPNNLLRFDNLGPAEDAAARSLTRPLAGRLAIFVGGGILALSVSLLIGHLLGYDLFMNM